LCFDYGIELDDVTSERKQLEKEMGDKKDHEKLKAASDEELYKIEIPANRYDLLCYEGLVSALNVFRNGSKAPEYKTVTPSKPLEMHVNWEQVRYYLLKLFLTLFRQAQFVHMLYLPC
jgi:phenylalanyl-tRNA synthetase beta chain